MICMTRPLALRWQSWVPVEYGYTAAVAETLALNTHEAVSLSPIWHQLNCALIRHDVERICKSA